MNNEILTNEDLLWIEADLRDQAINPSCQDCRRRVKLADKIDRLIRIERVPFCPLCDRPLPENYAHQECAAREQYLADKEKNNE